MSEKLLKDKTLGLIVFSYKAPLTLATTLESYRRCVFFNFFDDSCIFFIGNSKDNHAVAKDFGVRYVDFDDEADFSEAISRIPEELKTDYLLWVEHDCKLWGYLTREQLYSQFAESLDVLERGEADIVRLRHSWLSNPNVSAAALYSYYYEIDQLSSYWKNSEPLSQAPKWVKRLRRMFNPVRAKRWIGRSVYVEEHPHLIYPQYIKKEGNLFIVDSEVFQWSNQPSIFSRNFLLKGIEDLRESMLQGGLGASSARFTGAVNSKKWQQSHYKIAVAPGVFTWAGGGYLS